MQLPVGFMDNNLRKNGFQYAIHNTDFICTHYIHNSKSLFPRNIYSNIILYLDFNFDVCLYQHHAILC